VTNHVIVVLAEDAIRQTRCTTCDAEHPYKGGKEPRLRKKAPKESLYDQVLANATGASATDRPTPDNSVSTGFIAANAADMDADSAQGTDEAAGQNESGPSTDDVWPGHRTLIRASLPRSENEPPPPRPIPEFTMYQRPQPRGRNFRFGHQPRPFGHPHGNGNGNGNGEVNGNVNGNGNGNRPGRGGFDGHQGPPAGGGRRRRRRRSR
jgi:hypothetical protein